jgi:predicted glutamine amidotransferase
MCRLLGVVSATPTSVSQAVGEHVLKDFVALTKIHADGWGISRIRRPGHDPQTEVSAGSALDDPHFASATHDRRSAASLVHLRWATTGLAVQPENSHPFVADRIAMGHNGSIKPMGPLAGLLEPDIVGTLRGSTDSERYFALIRQHRASSSDLAEAVRRAVSRLRELYPDASLNSLVLGEDQLIAVHAHARSRLPDEDIAEITAADLPAEHLEDYFGLRWARPDQDTVVIASTGFGDLDWQPLPSESVTSVSMRDLSLATLPLTTPSTP